MPVGKSNRSKNQMQPIRSALGRTASSNPKTSKRAVDKVFKLSSKVNSNRNTTPKKAAAKKRAVKRTTKKP